jgi:hypothetical protein
VSLLVGKVISPGLTTPETTMAWSEPGVSLKTTVSASKNLSFEPPLFQLAEIPPSQSAVPAALFQIRFTGVPMVRTISLLPAPPA